MKFQLDLLGITLVAPCHRIPKLVISRVESLVNCACVLAVKLLGAVAALETTVVPVAALVLCQGRPLRELLIEHCAREWRRSHMDIHVIFQAAVGGELLPADVTNIAVVETLVYDEETLRHRLVTETAVDHLVQANVARDKVMRDEQRLPEIARVALHTV